MYKKLDQKIRIPVYIYGLFISLTLYQPENIGTYIALGTIILLFISCIFFSDMKLTRFIFPIESKLIFIYLILSIITTLIYVGFPSNFYRYIGQVILFLLLANIKLNNKEYIFIKNAFLLSTCFYATLALKYCIINQSSRFYHGAIILFGASFDPNFIGIPFTIASIFLLDNILKGKDRLINVGGLSLVYLAIVYTASRGNFLSAFIGGILVFYFFLKNKNINIFFRLLCFFLILFAFFMIFSYFALYFPTQWERMSQFNTYEDNGRFLLWKKSFELIEEHFIFGNGFQSMYINFKKASHNTYIQILVENGIIGMTIFILFIIKLIKKATYYDKTFGIVIIVLLVQILFLDAFDNRCVWAIFCWIIMLPKMKFNEN